MLDPSEMVHYEMPHLLGLWFANSAFVIFFFFFFLALSVNYCFSQYKLKNSNLFIFQIQMYYKTQ